jgi:Ca-activated chloride channel family protein
MIDFFSDISFKAPWFLLLLLLIPVLAWRLWGSRARQNAVLRLSRTRSFEKHNSLRARIRDPLLLLLRLLALAAGIVALARPQHVFKEEEVKADGIDIILSMDLSSSMLARDFEPDRLEVSKEVGVDFVSKRPYDRIGLVVFAGEAYTQCPLTTDHAIVTDFLRKLECGFLEDGTAIGMGLATAVNRLKESEGKSKVIILLTDGVNNAGYVQPMTAAKLATEFGIRIYTIGIGSAGDALAPVSRRSNGEYLFGLTPVEIDENLLQEIANMSGGRYFRAVTRQALEGIYEEIDQLEKTEIEVTTFKRYSEAFFPFALFAIIALALELFLRNTLLRTFP